jgi:hypothetical protein
VEEHAIPLANCAWLTDNVDDRDVFAVRSCYGIEK